MSETPASSNPPVNDRREIFGWTMYDWAVSAFSTTVVTVFLGPYLTSIAEGAADASGRIYLGGVPIAFNSFFTFTISASVLFQVTLLPVLGALADYSNMRKQLLILFSTLGAVSTLLMFFITEGGQWFGGLLFILANLSLGASIVFYNAYLPDIASEDRRDHVSASGFAMGYAGGGLLLLLNLLMFMFRESLGWGDGFVARLSLASAGAWWLGFSIITFTTLRPRHAVRPLPEGESYFTIGFAQLGRLLQVRTRTVTVLLILPVLIPILFLFGLPIWLVLVPGAGPLAVLGIFLYRKSRTLSEAVRYLLAYLLYNDGIQAVIAISAIFAVQELGMASTNLILVILMIQFVAFGGAYLFSFIAGKMGTRNAIMVSLLVWSIAVIYAFAGMRSEIIVESFGITQAELEFWILGFVIALVLGGSQALSRSLFSQMIPKSQEAEFFGFYEVSERGTSWLGAFIFGLANQLTGSFRIAILSLIFFFIVGLVLLATVNVDKAIEQGEQASVAELPALAD